MENRVEPRTRLVAKVVREVLQLEAFNDLPSLVEAVKTRCARLKLRGYERLVHDAIDLVASNRPVLRGQHANRQLEDESPGPRPLSPAEAADILRRVRVKMGRPDPVKPIGRVVQLDVNDLARHAFTTERRKAAAIVQQEILDSIARCEVLERKAGQ